MTHLEQQQADIMRGISKLARSGNITYGEALRQIDKAIPSRVHVVFWNISKWLFFASNGRMSNESALQQIESELNKC